MVVLSITIHVRGIYSLTTYPLYPYQWHTKSGRASARDITRTRTRTRAAIIESENVIICQWYVPDPHKKDAKKTMKKKGRERERVWKKKPHTNYYHHKLWICFTWISVVHLYQARAFTLSLREQLCLGSIIQHLALSSLKCGVAALFSKANAKYIERLCKRFSLRWKIHNRMQTICAWAAKTNANSLSHHKSHNSLRLNVTRFYGRHSKTMKMKMGNAYIITFCINFPVVFFDL